MGEFNSNFQGHGRAARAFSCAVVAALIASGCSSVPMGDGPTVAVLPGGGKSMPEFNSDDIACRSIARARAHDGTPLPVAMGLGKTEVASSRVLPVVRGATDSTGSVFGNAPAPDSAIVTTQQRYDTAYVQCMYQKGHKIPVGEAMSS